jgi:hypothetical protein
LFGPPSGAALAPDLVVTLDAQAGGDDPDRSVDRWAASGVSGSLVFDGRVDFPAIGMLLRLDDPLLPDVVGVTGVNFSFGQVEGTSIGIRARVLPGTAEGWAGTPYGE